MQNNEEKIITFKLTELEHKYFKVLASYNDTYIKRLVLESVFREGCLEEVKQFLNEKKCNYRLL